jgi:hypothetical protein
VIGRIRELGAAERFLDAVPAGLSGLVLEGEAGIGKSMLWRETAWRAQARGYRVLSTRPAEAEAKLSFSGLADLLADVEPEVFERLPAPQRRALEVALVRAEGRADRRALLAGFVSLLSALASWGPLVLAVDDVQWLDTPSLSALQFVVRRLAGRPVGVLISARLVMDAAPRGFERALADASVERLRVGPLSLAALHGLFKARLGRVFDRPTLVRIERATGGNPLFALEIARELLETPPAPGDALPAPRDVGELVGARICRLPARTREELLAAASLSRPTTALIDAGSLEPAERAGLVHVEPDGTVSFDHPVFVSAVYAAASPVRRRAVHRRLAAHVPDFEERARHLALASTGVDAATAATLSQAAGRARGRGAPDAAAELERLALRATTAEAVGERTRRALDLCNDLIVIGATDAARAALDDALAAAPAGDPRSEVLIRAGEIRWMEGDKRAGLEVARGALAEARTRPMTA